MINLVILVWYHKSLTNEISTIGSSRRLLHVTILFTLLDLQSTVKIKHTAGRFSTFHDSRRPVDSIYLPHRFISQSLPPKELGVFPSQRSGDIRMPPSIDSINKQVNMHTKSFRTLKCTSIPNSPWSHLPAPAIGA